MWSKFKSWVTRDKKFIVTLVADGCVGYYLGGVAISLAESTFPYVPLPFSGTVISGILCLIYGTVLILLYNLLSRRRTRIAKRKLSYT